jgi:hypothetical protein
VLEDPADRKPVTRGRSLRRVCPERFRRSRGQATVEALTRRIAALVVERQQLRGENAAVADLERNRLQLARAQWELAHALIDQHLPGQTAAA